MIHVDRKVDVAKFNEFADRLRDVEDIRFSKRYRCEWGTWGLVNATTVAAESPVSRS